MFDFKRNTKRIEVQSYLRRLADLTIPNVSTSEACSRAEQRVNRTLVAAVVSWNNGAPSIDEASFGTTKDISGEGLSLVLPHPYHEKSVLVGFWPWLTNAPEPEDEPAFFLAEIRQCQNIGGDYWQLGVMLQERLQHAETLNALKPLAQRLLPESVTN